MKYIAMVSLLTIGLLTIMGSVSLSIEAMTNNNPPLPPTIEGPSAGTVRTFYTYNITVVDPDDDFMDTLEVDFGDETVTVYECGCSQPRWSSGETLQVTHQWKRAASYTVRARVADVYGLWSDWSTVEVAMPLANQPPMITLFQQIAGWLAQFWGSTFFPFMIPS